MRVAIVGYDVEGQASYRYFAAQNADITIFDEAPRPRATPPEGTAVVSGSDALERLRSMEPFDVVMRTPSLAPHKLAGIQNISSATQEFFAKCPAAIIGVTGTKGKGTTCSFITSILRAAGETVHLVGNIGTPALDVLPEISAEDIVVFELSSFQLWDMHDSPHVAVVLKIEADHLDVHDSMDDYVSAKANICRWQKATDTVVYNPRSVLSKQVAETSSGVKLAYTEAPAAHIQDNSFYVNEQKICSTSTVVIPGKHNLENAAAAITAAWQFVRDPARIAGGLHSFEGLPHRIEYVRTVDGVRYYNDSYSSAPGATIAAVQAFGEPEILIMGGYDKGGEFAEVSSVIKNSNVKEIFLIGQTRHKIAAAFDAADFHKYTILDTTDFTEIIHTARKKADSGDVVILSPGCASFDMFKNFSDRGEQYKQIVNGL
jgi:UDP-N-acetylmuramoylalanine--D-glutamate ligase